jgi:hypothetical protein
VRHESAVLAPAHDLALDIEAEMGRFIERGMEAAGGSSKVKPRASSNPAGTWFQGTSLRSGCTPSGQPSGSTSRFR